MLYHRRPIRSVISRCIAALAVALFALTFVPCAHAQRVLYESLTDVPASVPIYINADDVATWMQGGQHVFLLKGNVVVTQGKASVEMKNAVIWADMEKQKTSGMLPIIVYGEESLRVKRENTTSQGQRGYVLMATAIRMDINSQKSRLAKEDRSNDPVYQQAVANRPKGLELPGSDPLGAPMQVITADRPGIPIETSSPLKQTAYFQLTPPEPKVVPVPGGPADGLAPPPPPVLTPTPPVDPAPRVMPRINIRGRYNQDLTFTSQPAGNGMTAVIVTGGVTVLIAQPGTAPGEKTKYLDIEADRLVIWTKGEGSQVLGDMKSPQGTEGGEHELYMSGHVELRTRSKTGAETVRADEVYYDVRRNVAVARDADLELQQLKLPEPIHVQTPLLIQENLQFYRMKNAKIYNSKIPSDPGLEVDISNLTVEERQVPRSYLFGWFPAYDKEGKRIVDTEHIFTGWNMVTRIENVPIFYFPYLKAKVEDPLGPLDAVNIGYNNIFGLAVTTTWDVYDLLNIPRPEGTRWRLFLDYLSLRGPGFGTQFDFGGRDYFGIRGNYNGEFRAYGIFDKKADVLGGDRGNFATWPDALTTWPVNQPNFRGNGYGKINVQDMDDGFSILGQMAFISDRNWLEQYYLNTQLNELNQDTYLRVKQQQNNWAWTLYGQVSTRHWLTETNWLPKADGYLLGHTFLDDLLVYNTHASLGYAQLRPTELPPFAYLPTDVRTNTFRGDWIHELSMPFDVGPFRIAPYASLDLAYYSSDVNGDGLGRLYGGGGVRANMPLSRLYPEIQSELFNLDTLYHKINFVGNYYIAQSSTGVNNVPQLQRLNDDATDQALRNIRPFQSVFNPANAGFLTTSNLFNPQSYAIRRLVDSNTDTLDSINVFQLGINQRWQTRRGFPGNEHVIDWMGLNVGVSVFPNSGRDNFGKTFGILEYDWFWNVGDRTAVYSNGWFEPWENGPRAFDFGVLIGRPDSSSFNLAYRQLDPLNSKAVIASVTYPFSAKYAATASTVWDFGVNVRSYSCFVSRMGTDLMFNFGLTYNSTLNTFGVAFEVLPNLARSSGRGAQLFPAAPPNANLLP